MALSGGPDSTALACALAALGERAGFGLDLVLGHVHHGLRGAEADADRDFAAEVARRLGLPFEERRIDVEAIRAEEGGSVEEVARRERYRFFEEVARARGLSKIAIAHHHDDQVETVLHRILRGTGIRGLSGMPRRRRIGGPGSPEVVRPFLTFSRAEVRGYLDEIGVTARHDRSNEALQHLRSRIRNDLLPHIRQFVPGVDRSLLRLAEAARQAADMLEGEASRRLDAAGVEPRLPVRIPLALLRETPPELRPILLMRAVERVLGAQLVSRHAEALVALAAARGSGGSATLPGGLVARRVYDDLVIERPGPVAAPGPPPEVRVRVPGRTEAPELGVAAVARVHSRPEPRRAPPAGAPAAAPAHRPPRRPTREEEAERTARFDLAQLAGPLVLRHPRPGDVIYPIGMKGKKKLQDLFVDDKVPRPDRAQALVLDAGGHLAWVVGLRIDRRFLVTDETREVLELAIEEL